MDKRKENFDASSLLSPLDSDADMVIPDRDTPGKRAMAWPQPIRNASIPFDSSMLFFPFGILDTTKSTKAVNKNPTPNDPPVSKKPLSQSSNSNAAITAGTVAVTSSSTGFEKGFLA
jgi:hypothetical protein